LAEDLTAGRLSFAICNLHVSDGAQQLPPLNGRSYKPLRLAVESETRAEVTPGARLNAS